MKKLKAQVSVEILVIVVFIIIISSVVIFSINEKTGKIEKLRENLHAKRQVEKVASAISNALYNGDGFTTNITTSKYVGNARIDSFIIYSSAKTVELKWVDPFGENSSVISGLSTTNIRADASSGIGDIEIIHNIINIYNNQSSIIITQYP